MGERERLAIFNAITSHFGTPDLDGMVVLDLFAGTGSLGLEALSRGATHATFIEQSPRTLRILKENLKGINNALVLSLDAYNVVFQEKFDIIFIDPPYNDFDPIILNFEEYLTDGGIMVVSSPEPIDETSRKYANCYITLVKN